MTEVGSRGAMFRGLQYDTGLQPSTTAHSVWSLEAGGELAWDQATARFRAHCDQSSERA